MIGTEWLSLFTTVCVVLCSCWRSLGASVMLNCRGRKGWRQRGGQLCERYGKANGGAWRDRFDRPNDVVEQLVEAHLTAIYRLQSSVAVNSCASVAHAREFRPTSDKLEGPRCRHRAC